MTEPKKKLSLPTGDKPARDSKRSPVRSSSTATPRIKSRPARDEEAPAPRRDATPGRDAAPAPRRREALSDETRNPARREGAAPQRRARSGDESPARPTGPRREATRPPGARPASDDAAPRQQFNRERAASATQPRERLATDAPHERRSRGSDGLSAKVTDQPAPARPAARSAPPRDPNGAVRLSKRMTELGLCSRREADEYIERGWVKVDGQIVDTLGSKVLPNQKIELNRQAEAAQHERLTILLHKPIGYVSGQAEDGYEPASVLITAENHWSEDPVRRPFEARILRKLAPAGRLDIDSTGLLVLTQDGRIARSLIGEDSDIEKEYLVRVEGPLSYDNLALLNHGLVLDGVELQPAKVSWQNEHQLRFVLREGRKRQIRRMCELVGLTVTGLKRIRIGSVKLAKLPPGQWRYLAPTERF